MAINVLNDQRLQDIYLKNQKVLQSLFKIVLLCGKQGFAFHGHRNDNITWWEEESDANHIELVRFQAETDEILHDHLKKAPKNAQYTSKTIQSEMIGVIGKHICDKM